MILPRPRLLLITDRRQARLPLEQVVEAALQGGCRWVSLRDRELRDADRRRLARRLVKLGAEYGATVTLHGDLAACEAARAAGVHVRAGTSPGQVRDWMSGRALVGASAHDAAEARQAAADGADYVTLSPIFASPSKPGYGPPLGAQALAEAAGALAIPVIALGGVTPENTGECLAAGAAGIAVMGAIMRAADPAAETARYLEALERG